MAEGVAHQPPLDEQVVLDFQEMTGRRSDPTDKSWAHSMIVAYREMQLNLRTSWNLVGFVLVYILIMLYGMGCYMKLRWWMGEKEIHMTVDVIVYLLVSFLFLVVHSLLGWKGNGLEIAHKMW
eukprot:765209-Hanusia_phi.AAC.1